MPDSAEPTDYRRRGLTRRVVVLTLILVPLNTYYLCFLHGPRGIEGPTVVALFYNVVFTLTLLVIINIGLRRWLPNVAFSTAELMSLFVLLSVGSCCGGQDTINTMFGTIQGATRFASPENHWEDYFFRYLPDGMLIRDEGAVERFWEGDHSIFEPRNYLPWLGPMIRWALFFIAMWTAPAGLAVIFRKRWVEREKMTFPIIQLPVEMSRPGAPYLRTKAFWIAFGAAGLVNTINGLHSLFPQVPNLPVKIWYSEANNLGRFFTSHPWNAIGTFYVCFYPFIIGLALLLPAELSLSLWFFYLFWKAEAIFTAWMGWRHIPEFPYMKEQSWGGYLALLAFSLYAAGPYFRDVWRRILNRGDPAIDGNEAMSYRAAFLLFLLPALYVIGVGIQQRLAWYLSVAFFVQYYVMTLIVGRMRAEMGFPTHEIERLGPTVMQGNLLGYKVIGPQNLTSLSVFFSFTRGLRNIPFPLQIEGLKLQETTGLDGRRLLLATIGTLVLGITTSFFWFLYLGYGHGLGMDWARWSPWMSREAWNQLMGWLVQPRGVAWGRIVASAIGFVFYFGLMLVRTRWLLWWPLHPAGFALSTTWYMAHMWFPMFLAWSAKTLVRRFWGYYGVRPLVSFAFGLILGDIFTGTCWILYSVVTRVDTYAFWP